jgi:hypothetical protein
MGVIAAFIVRPSLTPEITFLTVGKPVPAGSLPASVLIPAPGTAARQAGRTRQCLPGQVQTPDVY